MMHSHRFTHRGHHRTLRLGAISPEARESFLTTFYGAVDDAYRVLSDAVSAGLISEADYDVFVRQINGAEAEVETILAGTSTATAAAMRMQLDAIEQRVLDIVGGVRATIDASGAAGRQRMFWWSVAAVTLGLGAGFAWLAISKRKAK